jgi:hypothetical protein
MTKMHGGSPTKRQGSLNRGAKPSPTPPNHGGTHLPTGRVHAPPPAGSAVNRGGTFGMGTLKKRK